MQSRYLNYYSRMNDEFKIWLNLTKTTMFRARAVNFVPRVSHLTAPWGERASAPGGGKMRDPGNDVDEPYGILVYCVIW